MRTLQRWVDRVTTIIASIICAVFMTIIVYNVAARYFFDGGIQWYMEAAQYLNVWAMFIAGIGLSASNAHLRVSIVDEILRGRARTVDRVIVAFFTFLFYVALAYSSYLLATRARQSISTMEPLKMAYVYWMLPVTAALSALAVIVDLSCQFMDKPLAKEEGNDHILVD